MAHRQKRAPGSPVAPCQVTLGLRPPARIRQLTQINGRIANSPPRPNVGKEKSPARPTNEFKNWSGARDLNPGPHGPEPAQSRVLSCPMVSARFLLYSNWIFFVSSCDLVYPPGSLNALPSRDLQGLGARRPSPCLPPHGAHQRR